MAKTLLAKAEEFVKQILTNGLSNAFLYHNLAHTERVVKSTKEILENIHLEEDSAEIVLLAAWFHDTGYSKGYENHEKESVAIARKFLEEEGMDADKTDKVCATIMATQRGIAPKNRLEEIIKDADFSHFADQSFNEYSELLRQELYLLGIKKHTPKAWRDQSIDFFVNKHIYYTGYALQNWKAKKEENLAKLLKARRKERKKLKNEEIKARLKAVAKNESPERGIQTLYRVTLRNHIKLSDIADTKANILLSVNAIIISLVLASLIPKLDSPSNSHLFIPTLIFIFFSIISMGLSMLATRPNVTRGEFTREDVEQKRVNLLFFGNFHQMKLKEYEWAMGEVLRDKDYLYKSLTKDLYFLGLVLNRKYKILRITYTIFIIGIIISAISFVLAYKMRIVVEVAT